MARRGTTPPEAHPARLSPDEMRRAIPRLDRRIADLKAFDPDSVDDRSDPRIEVLEGSIDRTLVETFGPDTLDYERYRGAAHLARWSLNVMHGTPLSEIREGLERGVATEVPLH